MTHPVMNCCNSLLPVFALLLLGACTTNLKAPRGTFDRVNEEMKAATNARPKGEIGRAHV